MTKVLLVDDEVGILVILDALLSDAGYRTVLAGNGKQALELFASEQPDAVVLDWMMPILDGPATARAIRELRPQIPIVMMSGADEQALQLHYRDYSAFVRKPFRAAQALEAIRRALGDPAA